MLKSTLFELKQIPGFRQYYKIPYYIKNTISLIILALCMFIVDLLYFKNEGGSLSGTLKILRGMSSSTFNYLEAHKDQISVDEDLITFVRDDAEHMDVLTFQSVCLSFSKPCVFLGIASSWPATEKWNVDTSDNSYLIKAFQGQEFEVYAEPNMKSPKLKAITYSFLSNKKQSMAFDKFLEAFKSSPGHISLKANGNSLKQILQSDIKVPGFYDRISDYENITLFIGSHFMDKPLYKKNEQLMCAVSGAASIMFVAPVHRQEVYAGKVQESKSQYYDQALTQQEQLNVSPANFFLPNLQKYPLISGAKRHQVNLSKGDCVFIPSYYFYQLQGFHPETSSIDLQKIRSITNKTDFDPLKEKLEQLSETKTNNKLATIVSLQFPSNSELLNAFYAAIENEIIL